MKPIKKEDQNVAASVLYRNVNKILTGVWSRDCKKGHPKTAPPGDPSHIQSPKPDTIADAKNHLLTGA